MARTEYREEPCRSALNRVTGMSFRWSLNPYMGCAHRCTFCYVRAFERRADRPAGDAYGRSIRVKTNVATVLRAELGRRTWAREPVSIGAATDPYQPIEGRYRLTRACLEALADHTTPFHIITRGPLVVRDLDLLQHAAARAAVRVHFSIPTLDARIWSVTEPGTAPPAARLAALRRLVDGGIQAGVAMAPILPGLSDRPELLAAVVRAARDAGAAHLWVGPVHLRPGTREHFLASLSREWPALLPYYERQFATRAYLPRDVGRSLSEQVASLREATPRRVPARTPIEPAEPPVIVRQLGLALGVDLPQIGPP